MQQREEILIKVKDDLEAYDSENKKVKKKDKDIFILKDQLRVVNEQNQKLSQENDKIRHKTVTIGNEKLSPQ